MSEEIDIVGDFLAHYGVKGMRWGVRKDRPEGVSARTSREAKKDAVEFTKAKMFYGEGAGTRRKLIKATVEAKSKKDPSYKKAFDFHVEKTDLSTRASQARRERTRKDAVSKTTKTIRGVHRQLTGGFGSVSVTSAAVATAYMYARQTGADKVVANAARTQFNNLRNMNNSRNNMRAAQDFLKKMGM